MRIKPLYLFVIPLFALMACKKDDVGSGNSKYMSVSLNGKNEATASVHIAKTFVYRTPQIRITGFLPDGNMIVISIVNYSDRGTYFFHSTSGSAISTAFCFASGSPALLENSANRGKLTVTSSTDIGVKGTFDFITNDSTIIDNGTFVSMY